MSKSYKYPIFKDRPNKYWKRLSNKKNRLWLNQLTKGFKSTKLFKLLVDQYNICDWSFTPRNEQDKQKAKRK